MLKKWIGFIDIFLLIYPTDQSIIVFDGFQHRSPIPSPCPKIRIHPVLIIRLVRSIFATKNSCYSLLQRTLLYFISKSCLLLVSALFLSLCFLPVEHLSPSTTHLFVSKFQSFIFSNPFLLITLFFCIFT